MTSCFIKHLLPSNLYYRWREQLLAKQLITFNRWYHSLISLHMHHIFTHIAQNTVYEFILCQPTRRAFLRFHRSSLMMRLDWIAYTSADFIAGIFFVVFSPPTFGRFYCPLFFTNIDFFFSDMKWVQYRTRKICKELDHTILVFWVQDAAEVVRKIHEAETNSVTADMNLHRFWRKNAEKTPLWVRVEQMQRTPPCGLE